MIASTIERNARVEQDERQDQDEREHVREVAVDGVHEVAVGRARRRRASPSVPCSAALTRSMISLDAGRGAVDRRERLDERVVAACASRAARPRRRRPGPRAASRRSCPALPPCSTSTSNGFITPGEMPASASICRPAIAVPLPGKFFSCASFGLSCRPKRDEHGDDREPDERDRPRAAQDEPRPAAPRAVLGMAAVDEPLRHHAHAVDPLAEHREQRRQERDRREHRDGRDQHAADPDRADERQRQDDHREQADRDGRAGDDHRAAGVRHRLDERRLDVLALAQLVAEAEDHQQRVVDRDAEADERDEELDDDRDVRDVGQRPDERERVEDRGDRDGDRHQHAGSVPKTKRRITSAPRPPISASSEDARAARCRACSPPRADRGR